MRKAAIITACLMFSRTAGLLADDKSDFDSLFADEIKRVVASRNPAQAGALAGQMMLAAKSIKDRPKLHVMLWSCAADFGAKDPSGFDAATQALKNLLQAAPESSAKWVDKLAMIYRRRYLAARGAERAKVGSEQVDEFIAIGDAQTSAGRGRAAMITYRRALSAATSTKSTRKKEILEKIKTANAVATVQLNIEKLRKTLTVRPDDIKAREAIVRLQLVELDDPVGAAGMLTDDLDEKLRTYVSLAAKDIEELEAAPCFELGRWYWNMYPSVKSTRTKGNVLRRTKAYLERFKSMNTARDVSALTARVILEKVDAESTKLAGKIDKESGKVSKSVTIHWTIADDADVYLNGKPLREYKPDFRSRRDEARKTFSAKAKLSVGDVFTVGGRRGGSYGFLLVAIDEKGRTVWQSDTRHWHAYLPADENKWYLPNVALKSRKTTVTVNPKPWHVQDKMRKNLRIKAESIWPDPKSRKAYLLSVVR